MAGLRIRDRIFSRRVARAMMSRPAIATAAIGLTGGVVAGVGMAPTLLLGAAGWSVPVAVAAARQGGSARPRERIDPFALGDPWRTHVRSVLTYRARVHERADSTQPGPLRDRLLEIAHGVDTAVDEAWQVAKRGNAVSKARESIDRAAIDRRISGLEKSLAEAPDDPRLTEALDASLTQRSAAERMDGIVVDTDTRLRLLDARLGEVVVRAAELSAQIGDDRTLATLSSDVEGLLTDMEALRQALDETHGTAGGSRVSDPG